MNGKLLKTLIIFKGLKAVPKNLILPNNVVVLVAMKGSMTGGLMKQWANKVSWVSSFSRPCRHFSEQPFGDQS
jgi:hypothetical protein